MILENNMKKLMVILAVVLALISLSTVGSLGVWALTSSPIHVSTASLDNWQAIPGSSPKAYYDNITSWHFVITGIPAVTDAPDNINVVLTDDINTITIKVERSAFNGIDAQYNLPYDYKGYWLLGKHVTDAYTDISSNWNVIPFNENNPKYNPADKDGWGVGVFVLSHVTYSGPVPGVPELPAIALLAFGLVGVGGFILYRRRTQSSRS
jgi:hypothetical protein